MELITFELLKKDANLKEIFFMTNFSKKSIFHPDLILQSVFIGNLDIYKKRLNKNNKYNKIIKIAEENNIRFSINVKIWGDFFFHTAYISSFLLKDGGYGWIDEESFDIVSSEPVLKEKELIVLLNEYFASGKSKELLKKKRLLTNDNLQIQDSKNKQDILRGNFKKRWPEIKKKVDEMKRKSGLI